MEDLKTITDVILCVLCLGVLLFPIYFYIKTVDQELEERRKRYEELNSKED